MVGLNNEEMDCHENWYIHVIFKINCESFNDALAVHHL